MVYNESSIVLKNRLKELDKLKLTKTQEMLLKKLMDFNTLWQYDSLAIKASVYELYFDWSLRKEKEQKKTTIDGEAVGGEQNDGSKDKNKEINPDDD